MLNLSIGQFSEMIDGPVRLGTMPPLAGLHEPIGRITFDVQSVQPCCVFWALRTVACDAAIHVDEAFIRGARGVVVQGRRTEPWAGSFCITVSDGIASLHRLMRCLRTDRGSRFAELFASDRRTSQIVKSLRDNDSELLDATMAELFAQGAGAA